MSTAKPVLLSPMNYGKYCDIKLNTKIYRRVVRYSKVGGLYVVIATRRYYESEMDKSQVEPHKEE